MKIDFSKNFKDFKKIKSVVKTDFFSKIFIRKIYKKIKVALQASAIFFISILIVLLLIILYQKLYYDKFFAGISLANTNLSGESIEQARKNITSQAEEFMQTGINIKYEDVIFNLSASPIAANPDLSFDLFSFEIEKELQKSFTVGRSGNKLYDLKDQFLSLIFLPNKPVDYYLDEIKTNQLLQDAFNKFENPGQDAQIIITDDGIEISNERYGKIFDYDDIVNNIKDHLAYLNNNQIEISLKTQYPKIFKEQIEEVKDQAEQMLNLAPFTLMASSTKSNAKNKWTISQIELASTITAKLKKESLLKKSKLFVGLEEEKITDLLKEKIATDIDIKPVDAKFNMQSGKVIEFKTSKLGQKLNLTASFQTIENVLLENINTNLSANPLTIALVIDEVNSKITNDNVNNLGITELLGTGYSNFAGSPFNRRHNIKTGAWSVHGTLIPPGEEFSLLKTLGAINASTGYLPELVIKDNKTIPEYGGGLCQIGTTVFRATYNSGLPVTVRRNHSYRVGYYEPAGTDATIYNPAPDYKFLNDSKHYVLIQRRISGNNLYFDFWGTKDGRTSFFTQPKIYNITTPPPTKLVETDELKPGEKKCTEHAHNGADASFYYKIEYPNNEIKEETFTSHYRPWQEVCLVGKEISTSTPAILESKTIEKIFTE